MLNDIALVLGMIGTGWLALDVAKPEILKNMSTVFKQLTKHSFNPSFLWKKEFSETDHKTLSIIKIVGVWSLITVLAALQYTDYLSEQTLRQISYFPAALIGSVFIGSVLMGVSEKIAKILIVVPSYIILPVSLIYFFIFALVSIALQLFVKLFVSLEGKLIGTDQAPRFLGLVLIFTSFLLQFIALKS